MKYIVVGLYRRSRNDKEGESEECDSLPGAIALRLEWERSNRFRRVFIMKTE